MSVPTVRVPKGSKRPLEEETDKQIAGFHCQTTIKTIHHIKSRIKEEKEDKYSNSVAKIQVRVMFRAGDIRRNVLLIFIRLCMETPYLVSL